MARLDPEKKRKAFRLRLQHKSIAAVARELKMAPNTVRKLERGWVDGKRVRHRGWREELRRLWEEEEKKAELECGIALKEKRVRIYDRLMRQAVEAIEKSFPNIVAKNASDIKALLSEVRELCRLTSIELGQYRPGGGPVVAVRTDITLAEMQKRYRAAQAIEADVIPPPRAGTLISDIPEEDELEEAPDEASAMEGEVLEEEGAR